MAEKTLVESKVRESNKLIKALDEGHDSPQLAAWYYYEDIDDWRLILSGSAYDQLLPAKESLLYKKLAEYLVKNGISSIEISDIKFLKTDAPLLVAMSFIIGTDAFSLNSIRMSNNTFNGVFIRDVVLIRSAIQRKQGK
jgi:hypothetical protein